jgi:hypothetical protein
LSEPQHDTRAAALKSLKQGVARRLIGDAPHFGQKRYYDFNVRNHAQFVENLRYLHRNPVKRGYVRVPKVGSGAASPTMPRGVKDVEIESGVDRQKARKRIGNALLRGRTTPLKPIPGLSGPPAYVAVEPFHLSRYVDEQVFRFNNRGSKKHPRNDRDRFKLAMSQVLGRRLTYADLTGKSDSPHHAPTGTGQTTQA